MLLGRILETFVEATERLGEGEQRTLFNCNFFFNFIFSQLILTILEAVNYIRLVTNT